MRGISSEFLSAMRQGLQKGRQRGYVGWDKNWDNAVFPCPPNDWFMTRLHQEVDELVVALNNKDPGEILNECADIANFAMFIADINKP